MSNPRENQFIVYLGQGQPELLLLLSKRLRVSQSAVLRRALDELAERVLAPAHTTTDDESKQSPARR